MFFDGSQSFNTNHIIYDNDIATCFTSKKTPFKVRSPWPTGSSSKLDFIVKIIGKNLTCLDFKSWTGKNSVIVYVVLDFQIKSQFIGEFIFCELTKSSGNNCEYKCNCRGKLCQAYFIDLHDESESMTICEIQKII